MKAFRITITMPDGSQGAHEGLYADSMTAVVATEEAFPEATRIEALPLHTARAAQLCSHQQRLMRLSAQHVGLGQGARA